MPRLTSRNYKTNSSLVWEELLIDTACTGPRDCDCSEHNPRLFPFSQLFPSIKQEPQIVLAFIKKKQWRQRQAENPTRMADDSLSMLRRDYPVGPISPVYVLSP